MSDTARAGDAVIFINYRRIDAGWPADLLASALKRIFGQDRVFLDVRDIDAGDRFPLVLEQNLRRAAVLIVLIGKGWLRVQDEYGRRRLDAADDWVRNEIRAALQQGCKVIPVLIDDADLPGKAEALPEDIAPLLEAQRSRLRQATSEDDIDALSKTIEKAGFSRVPAAAGPMSDPAFSDELVADVVTNLRNLQRRQGGEFVARRELLSELDRLFNRKTFRFEALRQCPEQRWADRLDSAYQTEKVLRLWERNARAVTDDKYPIYVNVLKEVGSYCMQMGALLFEPPVDYNHIEDHIGKPGFKDRLPAQIRFPAGPDRQPEIPAEINNAIERHRKRAVTLMTRLAEG